MMWQEWVVGAVVALAGVYALWYWLPGAWRKRLGAVRPALGKAPSCGSCSDCGGCAPVRKGPAPGAAQKSAPPPVWMAPPR